MLVTVPGSGGGEGENGGARRLGLASRVPKVFWGRLPHGPRGGWEPGPALGEPRRLNRLDESRWPC